MTPWTAARQAPLSMGFSKQEHWSGLPFPAPGDLPDPGIKLKSPALQANSLPSEAPGKPLVDNSQKKKNYYEIKIQNLRTHTLFCTLSLLLVMVRMRILP